MAFDIEYFQKINNAHNTSNKKDVQLHQLKTHVNNHFADTIDCYNVPINNIEQELIITRTTNHFIKSIKARPYEDFNVGDYVTYEKYTWLIIEKDLMSQEYSRGKMKLCNYTLKFQNQDGTILSYPCITSDTTFSENANQTVISLGENKKSILLPFDENTSGLKVDDRMFIDRLNKTPFKIIGSVDNVSYSYGDKGLIYFIAEQDVLITTGEHPDRTDLGVCDYFEPITSPTLPENKNYSIITHTGNPEIRIGGSTKTFTCTAYDEFDNIVEIIPVWTITTLPEFETYIHKTETGNTIKIKADDVANMIQSKIKLEVSDVSGDYYSSIYITIVSGV